MIPKSLDESNILNLADVSRWGVVSTARHENVAEHSYQVAILFSLWYREATGVLPPAESVLMALLHDEDEAIYGDAPSPVDPEQPSLKSSLSVDSGSRFNRWWFDPWLVDVCDKTCALAFAIKYANGYNRSQVIQHIVDKLQHIQEIGRHHWAISEYGRGVNTAEGRRPLNDGLLRGIVYNSLYMILGDLFHLFNHQYYIQIFNPQPKEQKNETVAVPEPRQERDHPAPADDDRYEGDRVRGERFPGDVGLQELRTDGGGHDSLTGDRVIGSPQ